MKKELFFARSDDGKIGYKKLQGKIIPFNTDAVNESLPILKRYQHSLFSVGSMLYHENSLSTPLNINLDNCEEAVLFGYCGCSVIKGGTNLETFYRKPENGHLWMLPILLLQIKNYDKANNVTYSLYHLVGGTLHLLCQGHKIWCDINTPLLYCLNDNKGVKTTEEYMLISKSFHDPLRLVKVG